ncbi:MAG: AAA family ATPase, partial [Gemmataceae bacterium]
MAIDGAKPPFLRRVRIRNYKSIGFCDVSLEPLTILVGRNGSGKSNFVDALLLLRDTVVLGVDEAVRRHGGSNAILHRAARDRSVAVEVECGSESDERAAWPGCTYSLELS